MSQLKVHFSVKTADTAINLDLIADLGLPSISDSFEQRAAHQRFRDMTERLNQEGLVVDASEVQLQSKDLEYPSEIEIDVLLLPWEWRYGLCPCFSIGNEHTLPMGFHAQTTGEGLLGESHFNERHQVVIFVPDDHDLKVFLQQSIEDVDFDLENMEEAERFFYNTLTHEISHVLLFAEASGGLTSYQIDVCFDDGSFPYDRHSVSTGRQLLRLEYDYQDCESEAEDRTVMEELVETQGYALLKAISSPSPIKRSGVRLSR